jgi:hypothetical protein
LWLFEAAYIFPPEKESIWIENNYGSWIIVMSTPLASQSKDIHTPFEQYFILVNSDVKPPINKIAY